MHRAELTITNPDGKVIYHQLHTAPSNWKEMERRHLMAWASAMGSKLKIDTAQSVLAAMLFQIPVKLYKHIRPSMALTLARATDFLFKKNDLDQWLIPSFRHRLFKYHGPKSRLANLTVDEFSKCEFCYEQFDNTGNREYIETLAAILYRPRRWWGVDADIRNALTDHGYIKRAERFKKIPEGLKTAIYLNYEGCRHHLHARYKEVFTSGKKIDLSKKSKPNITPWAKIIESGAGDIFGTMQATGQTNLHQFLSRLCTRIKDAKELERNNKDR